MAYALNRSIRKIKQLNYWGVIAGVFFLFCVGAGLYYGRMYLEKGRVEKDIVLVNKELTDAKSALNKEKDDTQYKKYQAAKQVMSTAGNMNRNENIEYLVDLLDELTELDTLDNSVQLENFQITDESINLQGSVFSITSVYKEGGVIDKFESFDFIENISIPSYTKNEDEEIEFVLDASIQDYEGYEGSL